MTPAVTALRERARDRIEVELDGKPWRVLPLTAVARAELRVGGVLDRGTARTLARELRRGRALAQATRTLTVADRSRRALEERLARSGHAATARSEALATLERVGLVDDARMARNRAEALAGRGYGDAAIRADLLRRLVPDEIAAEAVSSLAPELERARALVESNGMSVAALRRLAARGFSPETVEELGGAFAEDP